MLDRTGPEPTRPDQTGLDRGGYGMERNGLFHAERQLICTAKDRIRRDQLQLGTEQTRLIRNST